MFIGTLDASYVSRLTYVAADGTTSSNLSDPPPRSNFFSSRSLRVTRDSSFSRVQAIEVDPVLRYLCEHPEKGITVTNPIEIRLELQRWTNADPVTKPEELTKKATDFYLARRFSCVSKKGFAP
jgi:hypothetical protein